MLTQIIWLATLPLIIYISYRLVLLVFSLMEKRNLL
jgi:hypothetical protein